MEGKIGIVYSPGFGAGWSTWGEEGQALDQELAQAINRGAPDDEIVKIAEKNWPGCYKGGLLNCTVDWVEPGTEFYVDEYDGFESIVYRADGELWRKAVVSDDKPRQ